MDAILDYVLLHFYSVYGKPAQLLGLRYGYDGQARVQVRQTRSAFFEGHYPFPEKVVWRTWRDRQIPFFFEETAEDTPLITMREGQVLVTADVIASAFYLLSGWQEYYSDRRDQFGRFPYASSVQHQHGFVAVPVVNYYFDILKSALEQAYGTQLRQQLWQNTPFAACLTHDVDRLASGWKIGGLAELQKGRILATIKLLGQKMVGRDAWYNLEEVMDLDEHYGARATFFFLCQHQKYQGHPNADYDIAAPRYGQLVNQAFDRGHEVGVHGSFETAPNALWLQQEQGRLGQQVRGNRFHYLSFDPKVTPAVLDSADLDYDSTLGFAEHFGFRHGYCHPLRLFDFRTRRPHRFLEIPLHLMDVTLHHPNYLQLHPDEMLEAVKPMLQEIEKFQGCLTVLWHNENFLDHAFPGGRDVYEQILQYVTERKAVYLTCTAVTEEMKRAGLL